MILISHPHVASHLAASPHLVVCANKQHACQDSANETTADAAKHPHQKLRARRIGRATVIKENESYTVTFDVPGVKEGDISISQTEEKIEVTAMRRVRGSVVSSFSQTLVFDDAKADVAQTKADLTDGVLTLTVPTKPASEPIKVSVVSAEPPSDGADTEDFVYKSVDLPGVKLADVNVTYDPNKLCLLVAASRADPFKPSLPPRSVQYAFDGRSIDPSGVEAFLTDGVLTIKAALRKTRNVTSEVRMIPVNDEIKSKDDDEATVQTGGTKLEVGSEDENDKLEA